MKPGDNSNYARRASRRTRALSLALLLAGAGLLGYVGSQYFQMYRAQQGLETEWHQQGSLASVMGQPGHPPQPMLTRLEIPKIKLDAIVLEGVSPQQLARGPGHIEETAQPGEPGNAVITAHRDTFFRHIFDLNEGDEIVVRRGRQVFRFEVTGKEIVEPDDLSVLRPASDARLTLITCYPPHYIGPAPQRLVVFSRIVQ